MIANCSPRRNWWRNRRDTLIISFKVLLKCRWFLSPPTSNIRWYQLQHESRDSHKRIGSMTTRKNYVYQVIHSRCLCAWVETGKFSFSLFIEYLYVMIHDSHSELHAVFFSLLFFMFSLSMLIARLLQACWEYQKQNNKWD